MITVLVLLATLLLIQARMPLALATWEHLAHTAGPALSDLFQPLFAQLVALPGDVVTQEQSSALGFAEPHTIASVHQSSLQRSLCRAFLPLQQINTLAELGAIHKLTEGVCESLAQINIDTKQNWPSSEPWGTPLVTICQMGVTPLTTTLGLATQPVFNLAKSPFSQAMSRQFLQENAVGNSAKSCTNVQVNNMHSLSLINQEGHLATEEQVS
ncbi:hypothetical protein TURU_124321 [Turdus rufiventris]|nr:hypothetical protein TURU_124321 [Turdus rufiventris]